jgi:hypothetical protein
MMNKTLRNYDSQYRKKLVNKIKKLTIKEDYINIYNIITSDIGTNFSSNINGLFLNVNLLSDDCINKINIFLDSKLEKTTINSNVINTYKTSTNNEHKVAHYKLSNQEKTIIKRFRDKEHNESLVN